jgi:predicted NAD/FAD-dependent oxidoreductase
MSALVTRALLDLDVRFETQVGAVVRDDGRWRLTSTDGHALGQFDALVLAAPAPQAAALIDAANFAFASRLREVAMEPCHAVMATFAQSLGLEWDAAFSNVGPLSWLARDSSKPERASGERWVFHTTAEWSRRHLDEAPEAIIAQVMDAVFASTGARRVEPTFAAQHRWRYATTSRALGEDCLFDADSRLVACGDWCRGGRIEGAFLSGLAAGGRLNALAGAPAEPDEPPFRRHPAQLRLIDS